MKEDRQHQVADERARRMLKRKEQKTAILTARRTDRNETKLTRLDASNLRATKAALRKPRAATVKSRPSTSQSTSEKEMSSADNSATVVLAEPTDVSVAPHLSAYLDEYLRAEEVVREATARLITLRGGKDALTPDDRDVLDNMRDIVSARQNKYLEE